MSGDQSAHAPTCASERDPFSDCDCGAGNNPRATGSQSGLGVPEAGERDGRLARANKCLQRANELITRLRAGDGTACNVMLERMTVRELEIAADVLRGMPQ